MRLGPGTRCTDVEGSSEVRASNRVTHEHSPEPYAEDISYVERGIGLLLVANFVYFPTFGSLFGPALAVDADSRANALAHPRARALTFPGVRVRHLTRLARRANVTPPS